MQAGDAAIVVAEGVARRALSGAAALFRDSAAGSDDALAIAVCVFTRAGCPVVGTCFICSATRAALATAAVRSADFPEAVRVAITGSCGVALFALIAANATAACIRTTWTRII